MMLAYKRLAEGGRVAKKIERPIIAKPTMARAAARAHCLSGVSSDSRGPRRSSSLTVVNLLGFSAAAASLDF